MIDIEFLGAMLRGVHLASLVSLFGTLLFAVVVLRVAPPSPFVPCVQASQMRLAGASAAVALVAAVAWFAERAAAMAGAGSLTETLTALPMVAWHTRFGRLILLRSILLVILWPLLRHRRAWPLAIFLAGLALGSQAATSHAGAIVDETGPKLVFVEALHLLAAGAWLGALMPLLLTLSGLPSSAAPPILRRFFPLGLVAVALVGGTSVIQASHLVGSVPALVGTPYGRTTLMKLGLFLLLLGFAALNRFVFTPTRGDATRRSWLRWSIAGETVIAGVLMLAAGSLAHQTPGTHVQPEWPFAWRINPDPAGALLVPAHPASYRASPTGFAAASIMRGQAAFEAKCTGCHGSFGKGDGDLARTLPAAPADLTARPLLALSDGDLYRRVGHSAEMPEDARWDLVDYLRANNRGNFVRTSGRKMIALRIPSFGATCTDGRSLAADDLRGQVLRIVVSGPGQASAGSPTAASITMPAAPTGPAEPCLAPPDAVPSLAILLGTTQAELAGTQLLIDANGWMRGNWRPGEPGGWGTPALLLARAQALADRPLPPDGDTQAHRH